MKVIDGSTCGQINNVLKLKMFDSVADFIEFYKSY